MAQPLNLTIVSPEKVLFEGDVSYISVPGQAGSFGVLVDHAPLMAALKAGTFEVRPLVGKSFQFTTTRPGFFEVIMNKASIILDADDTKTLLTVGTA
jgi:F-type H+-transporting ATPase subunit epsilon